MKSVHIISFILLVVGGLNWGLVGIGVDDLVTRLLGDGLAQAVFILVGLAAVVEVITHKKSCNACGASGSSAPSAGTV
ncbi:MAG TPA: DUF378 domain-containing protein [Candidatus Taylorbacteria bacterium]|nr:MAG: hypothetical protein UY03_C0017G0006 [Parcubacteria group bacterium GW2011_GWA2_47_64]KKU96277.1 MAG: hypothetical protein UY29_C0014G0013 [Parcubacteria group bacterium GW2011_GWC2_48_17]HBV01245.1 DUF378 domain-containing protein [Candidatus Taylorbacteria bacterium]